MEWILLVLGTYGLLLLVLAFGFARITEPTRPAPSSTLYKISIVVAARNEAHTILRLLDDLRNIDYPRDRWELVVVDDHSTDDTFRVIDPSRYDYPLIKLSLAEGSGKKDALAFAIAHTSGQIVATTDADCRVPAGWLTAVNEKFQVSSVRMVVGGVRLEENAGFFARWQALEFVSVAATGAATLGLSVPTMCNGANLAFSRESFMAVGGYSGHRHIASGDDQFLMMSFHSHWPGSVVYLSSPETVITTIPCPDVRSFMQQRIRWAGKWKLGLSASSRVLAVFIATVHVGWVALPVAALLGAISLKICLLALAGRFFLESIYLMPAANFYRVKWRWTSFIALQLLYSPYVIYVAIASLTSAPEWKGRRV